MTCVEFEQALPDVLEGARDAEQAAHLKSCKHCSNLVADLNFIVAQAKLLQFDEEPSPRVWNSLEIALKQEGLIRQPQPVEVGRASRGWRPTWLLAPLAAALLVGLFIYERGSAPEPVAEDIATQAPVVTTEVATANPEDEQVLQVVEARFPALRTAYQANLQTVNAYIRDAQEIAERDPNDQEAQRSLMDAYEQKAVVYEMALDRSLP
jgi:hypothetical protein